MLAPFGHPLSSPINHASIANLAPKCLLKDTEEGIQMPSSENAISTPSDDGFIHDGCHIIAFTSRETLESIIVKKGITYHNKNGHFSHDDFIGQPYGSKVRSKKGGKGFICLLKPTAELWSLAVSRRTEILYISDISMIIANLNLRSGSIVVETGTGTGALSTAMISAIQPTGRLYTFEYHPNRAQCAANDFYRNGLSPWVTITCRDTIRDGFPAALEHQADAVFLDLPSPATVVPAAKRLLKHNGMFCSFSPCIEQIQGTAEKLAENGFTNIETIECLQRAYDVRTVTLKDDYQEWEIKTDVKNDTTESEIPVNPKKRPRPESPEIQSTESNQDLQPSSSTSNTKLPKIKPTKRGQGPTAADDPNSFKLVSKPYPIMRGHTGYLIFARCYDHDLILKLQSNHDPK